MGFFAVLAASLFAVFLFTVFGGYSLLLWCQQSLWVDVPENGRQDHRPAKAGG